MTTDPFGWVGHVLDSKYRVDSVVGEGGFGVVYRAKHLGFGEDVAVKCLKLKPTLDEDTRDEFLKRFLAEGKLLHQLSRSTADVVQALDVGVAASPNGIETPYLVLEWLEGTTLDRELQARPKSSLEEAVALLEPAARGLAHAHDQGISHRDIKPANLMLCDVSGRLTLKVVDFGIAKAPDDSTTSVGPFDSLGTPMQAFTPRYGAPEQFSRRYGATGTWTDVYALALVLVEVVLGEPALEGDDPVQLYIASSDLQRRPTLRAYGIETSDAVEQVLVRALAVDPRSRYRTAGEFWDALGEAMVDPNRPQKARSIRPQPVASRPPEKRVFDREEGKQTTSTQGTGSITLMVLERQRKRLLWVGAVLVLLGIAAGLSWGFAKSTPPQAAMDAAPPTSAPIVVASVPPVVAPPPNMVLVAAARFVMGSDKDSRNEKPLHSVTITRAFFIDRTEVTAEAWAACVHAGACTPNVVRVQSKNVVVEQSSPFCNATTDPNLARQPVNCVSYEQAAAYCVFAGKRLPTEAEWELAARGADSRMYPWGDDPPKSCKQAIVGGIDGPCGKRKGTYDVGTTIDGASPSGALDMAGNVWEWVADSFETYPAEDVTDPYVPARNSPRGILRGGSWDYTASFAKTVTRLPIERAWAHPNIGFRCARTVNPSNTP